MPKPSWSGAISRKIVRRIVVEGDLVLQTPAHFGNGDGTDLIDMPLLTDSLDDKMPLLTGSSIAGALRSYVREREHGFRQQIDRYTQANQSASVLLFGSNKGNEYGEQSALIVEDAYGKNAAIELRDGVRLEGASRTSAEGALFTIEMWKAGTTFPLRFELIVRENDDTFKLKRALATALVGFKDGGVTLGSRKRRGYGQTSATGWRVKEYDLTNAGELLDWIATGASELSGFSQPDIVQALGVGETITDQRRMFRLKGEFSLDGSLLIRSGSGPDSEQEAAKTTDSQHPDMIHLHSARLLPTDGTRGQMPIVSGTSLAGALRARAFKIARFIAPPTGEGKKAGNDLIEHLFGADMEKSVMPEASRITASEHVVSEAKNTLVQNRVSLDRFTGGARDGALFSEQPLFGGPQSRVLVDLHLANPQACEIGLLLLVLKDLWTGDLPLGGEISVGRGRLYGQVRSWDLYANKANGLTVAGGQRQDLEHYVAELHAYLDRSRS